MDQNSSTQVCGKVQGSADQSEPNDSNRHYLIVLRGPSMGAMLRLNAGCVTVGRATECHLHFADSSISRHHATLTTECGRVRLVDLGSTNGTYLNNKRLAPMGMVELSDGDRLQLGTATLLKFTRPDALEEKFCRELFDRSVRDALTGLYNRSYFIDEVRILHEKAARLGLGLALILLDVDHFKLVNDTHGHDAGDTALREIAAVLRQSTRPDDLVARYGGEEFVLALPVGGMDSAFERAEHLRRMIYSRRVRLEEGPSLSLTASLGVTFASPFAPFDPSSVLSLADRALYMAKQEGRDRVVLSRSGAMPCIYGDAQRQTVEVDT